MTHTFSPNTGPGPSYRFYMTGPSCARDLRPNAVELKFVVPHETGARVRDAARTWLDPDPHGSGPAADQYRTTTLYFDTDEFAVYHRRGSYRRAKFRVRRYGDGDTVFLERKLRTAEMLSKRRSIMAFDDLPRLAEETLDATSTGRWFHERLRTRRLSAVCEVSYVRTARVGSNGNGPIRLTLDDRLTATRSLSLAFGSVGSSTPILNRTIVEMKFAGEMPAVFKRVVEDFALEQTRVSKYRLGVEATRELLKPCRGES